MNAMLATQVLLKEIQCRFVDVRVDVSVSLGVHGGLVFRVIWQDDKLHHLDRHISELLINIEGADKFWLERFIGEIRDAMFSAGGATKLEASSTIKD